MPPAGHEGPIPDDLVDEEHAVHEQLVEGIVVGDDDLMERYLNGETLDYTELEKSLAGGVASASVFPVLCCSAASGVGVDRLARLIEELCPTPGRPGLRVHGDGGDRDGRDPLRPGRADTLLTVTKTFNDSHTGKMSLCKVLSGTLQPDAVLVNSRTREEERLHALQSIAGHATAPATTVAGGRLRGRAPTQRDPHRRHPRAQGPAGRRCRPRRCPRPPSRWRSSRRPGPTTTS